jgi:hypothetical protein
MSNVDSLIKSLQTLSPELKRELARRLDADVLAEVSAADTAKAQKARLTKIAAMRAERRPAFMLAQGELSRLGIAIDDVSDVIGLDRLFASAVRKPTVEKRMQIKDALYHCGLITAYRHQTDIRSLSFWRPAPRRSNPFRRNPLG